jgi:1-phosphofructokinase family hexose kinase
LIYCTLFNPAVDAMYEIDEIATGTVLTNAKSKILPAGNGINVAAMLKILGEEACVFGIVHENNHKQFTEYLGRLGIESHFQTVPGTSRINVTLVETKAGQTTRICGVHAHVPSGLQEDLFELLRSKTAPGDLLACCGNLPAGMSNDSYEKLIKICKEKGALVMLDCGGKPLKMGVRAKPHMVKPNLEELEGFFGENIQGVHHIAFKGKRLLDMGMEFVFISLGSDGMIAIHGNDCLLCLAPHVRAMTTVGCGDALVAGLLAGQVRKFSFTEMCRMAVACGASNALHGGAGSISRDEIWRLMEEVTIKAV